MKTFDKYIQQRDEKILYLIRGPSGTGKSTLARELKPAEILSTDDYFTDEDGQYNFDPKELKTAHQWNQRRAQKAMEAGVSPLAIDNTFTQAWEARFYVDQALKNGYKVEIVEPNWSNDLRLPKNSGQRAVFGHGIKILSNNFRLNVQ